MFHPEVISANGFIQSEDTRDRPEIMRDLGLEVVTELPNGPVIYDPLEPRITDVPGFLQKQSNRDKKDTVLNYMGWRADIGSTIEEAQLSKRVLVPVVLFPCDPSDEGQRIYTGAHDPLMDPFYSA